MAISFIFLKSIHSLGYLTNHLSMQYSSWGLFTAHRVGCESHVVPKDENKNDQSISTFFYRLGLRQAAIPQIALLPLAGLQLLPDNHKYFA
jgi:hypothetical protein